MTEFELIARYFTRQPTRRPDVVLGVGDDCALLRPPAGLELAITTDLLVAGVHFQSEVDPAALGHKALAVNLSDLAAMGAQPAWFTLNLALPEAKPDWLERFSAGMFDLAERHEIALVGGDTSRGPLVIGIQACGFVPQGQALVRGGARPGDRVFVTGELGDAALALEQRLGRLRLPPQDAAALGERLDRPVARVAAGLALRGIASSAIDISDGLAADLGHILEASRVGARIMLERVPVSDIYQRHFAAAGWELALTRGDDYELCFTVPPMQLERLRAMRERFDCLVTEIGEIVAGSTLEFIDAGGRRWVPRGLGHDHFAWPPGGPTGAGKS